MDLFGNEAANKNQGHLYNQLIKLGDMMGDGLHHESDGKWILREYRRVSRLLMPDAYKEMARSRNAKIDKQMAALLADKKCDCTGTLRQVRSGSKVCKCNLCGEKYQAKNKNKPK